VLSKKILSKGSISYSGSGLTAGQRTRRWLIRLPVGSRNISGYAKRFEVRARHLESRGAVNRAP
jgi:glutamine synthetase